MPAGDRTGPNGEGAMTGRGLGKCNGNDYPGAFNNFRGCRRGGRGFGRGYARGAQGFGYRRYQNATASDQKSFLENEKEILKNQMDDLQKRISELEEE
ncbi:MAG: DUF5320 domain-containing protein [Fusobacteriota bacterium]